MKGPHVTDLRSVRIYDFEMLPLVQADSSPVTSWDNVPH
jgi:hypothetical protein